MFNIHVALHNGRDSGSGYFDRHKTMDQWNVWVDILGPDDDNIQYFRAVYQIAQIEEKGKSYGERYGWVH